MARRVLLLRHGDVGEENRGRYIGSSDVPLSAAGVRRVEGMVDLFPRGDSLLCLCSPLRRCRETADVVSRVTGLDFAVDPDLREVDFGDWEGKTFAEISESLPAEVEMWSAFDGFAFPGGESVAHFLSRVRRAAGRMAKAREDTVLACTHGGVIRSLICHFLGIPPRNHLLFVVEPASLTTVELYDGGGVLVGLNETGRRRC
ncbi:MAG: histidine phosphatase family protein [Syntrophobacterales bacterium]|nr:histidine phosphatase family protein [Syntrophobacterales bacterium]